MNVALGIDVGTTSARGIAVDEGGQVLETESSPYPLSSPRPNWSEQNPADWWAAARQVTGVLAQRLREEDIPICGIGLSGQMHGSVFLDRTGDVIRNALLWNDQRTARQCEEIIERIGIERLLEITGSPAVTGFQAPKVLWLRDEEPQAYQRVARVLLPKDYIRFQLTGDFATDVSDAAGTLFLDIRRRTWSRELLDALEVPEEWFPTVYESPQVPGVLSSAIAEELGLPGSIPVAAGAGDNAAAAVGAAVTRAGIMSSSIGTSGVLFVHSEACTIDPSRRLHSFCDAVPEEYCLQAVTLSAGGSTRWWRDVTGMSYDAMDAEAERISPGSEGLMFLPYLTGERTPHLDPESRGAFVGLTSRHTRAHMTRAVMEGVLFSLRDGLEIIKELEMGLTEIRALGGGAASNLWRQLQADVYAAPIHRLETEEGAAYGAALLGHLAAGTFATVDEATAVVRTRDEVVIPDPAVAETYDSLYAIYRSLYTTMSEDMHRLTHVASSLG